MYVEQISRKVFSVSTDVHKKHEDLLIRKNHGFQNHFLLDVSYSCSSNTIIYCQILLDENDKNNSQVNPSVPDVTF